MDVVTELSLEGPTQFVDILSSIVVWLSIHLENLLEMWRRLLTPINPNLCNIQKHFNYLSEQVAFV